MAKNKRKIEKFGDIPLKIEPEKKPPERVELTLQATALELTRRIK